MEKDTFNRGGFIAFIGSMIFSLLFFVYVSVVYPGIDLKEVPEGEAVPGQSAADGLAEATIDLKTVEDPWVYSDERALAGKKVYQVNCAVCHGPEGRGDGPAGKALVPPARDLVQGPWKRGGDAISMFVTLQKGLEGGSMTAFKHIHPKERWGLVHYIRSITQAWVEVDPAKIEEFARSAD